MTSMNKVENTAVRYLSEEGVRKIHESTLTALEDIGVVVLHQDGLSLLADSGAKIDDDTMVAKISSDIVEQCLDSAPKQFTMAGREEKYDLYLEPGGKIYGRNGGGPGHIVDIETGKVRDAIETDVRDYARLVDAMEFIDIVAPLYASDFPSGTRDIRVLKAMFESTSKHINIRLLEPDSLPYILKMAEIVAGSKENLRQRPIITMLESPIAPLKIPEVLIKTLLACGDYGVPVEICSMPIAGATGPITLAGSLLMSNIEMVASLVISQLANPGAPLVFTPRIMVMDMSTGYALSGSIENALLAAAGVQLAIEAYQIPVNMHGPYTDSQMSDAQSGIENTYFTFLAAMAGANILTGAGHLEGGLIISLTQLLIDNELMGIVQRSMDGFEVDDNTLGLDVIARSIEKDSLLADKHTLKNLRTSRRYSPQLLTREPREKWAALGSKTMEDRAREAVKVLLKSHTPVPLGKDLIETIDEVVMEASSKLDD